MKIQHLSSTAGLVVIGIWLIDPSTGPAKTLKVNHEPGQPKSGERVRVSLEFSETPGGGDYFLEYQIVEPGKYVALKDPEFEKSWTRIKLEEAEANASRTAGGPLKLSAQIPSTVQKHRRLIRYRMRSGATDRVTAPPREDTQPNYAYFVYDGVPPWKGAIDPHSSEGNLRQRTLYSSQELERVAVYHFISKKSSVENATWFEPTPWQIREGRNQYKYTGSLVYDGVVYDHIGFRARGGEWRHAMGKNMWKFDFLGGHRFQARDNYEMPYPNKWDKLNLGACIQQGDTHLRGEAGMFEAVGFRLFNLAGVEAPRTHWVHLRIIDGEEESPDDQYAGDFWGLYLAVENVDGHFLKGHNLPAGNVYKMEFDRPKTEYLGNPAITNQSDVFPFLAAAMNGGQRPIPWWRANVELNNYYSYRSIVECIHHYDLDAGKNYFLYLNSATTRWTVIPWDIDLTWGDRMYGAGYELFFRSGLLRRSPCREQYQERLAEIRDLLFNPEQVGWLIDEYARLISGGEATPSIVDADRAKWDFNPVLASPLVLPKKAGQGRFYSASPTNRFQVMVEYMKGYASHRAAWVDESLLADYQPPEPPHILADNAPSASNRVLKFHVEPRPGSPLGKVDWRLAEITDPKGRVPETHQPWKYEIQAVWQKELENEATVEAPATFLIPDHFYRVRARWLQAGRWSRWSEPIQFTAK